MDHMPPQPGDPEQVIVTEPDAPGPDMGSTTMTDLYNAGHEYIKAMWEEIDARREANPDTPLRDVVDGFLEEMNNWNRATGSGVGADPAKFWDAETT